MSNNRRRLTGTVISNKMDKTVVVKVTRTGRHPLYGKVISTDKKYMAHDEGNRCEMGDSVVIVESQPISRHKRWVVQEIVGTDLSARTADVADLVSEVESELAEAESSADDAAE